MRRRALAPCLLVDGDDGVWLSDFGAVRFDPATETFRSFELPA